MSGAAQAVGHWVVIAAAVGLGAIAATGACTLELEPEISCGDGYIDRAAGEECEPSMPESYRDACESTDRADGEAGCDPVTCEIDNSRSACAICGDGIVDRDAPHVEECEIGELQGQVCPGGVGELSCDADCRLDFSRCEACGNGVTEDDEECDPSASDAYDIGTVRPCAGSDLGTPDEGSPLPSPFPDKPYTSGSTSICTDSCEWNRLGCGYCGDGVIDIDFPVDLHGNRLAQPEICDGDLLSPSALETFEPYYSERCAEHSARPDVDVKLRPNVSCGPNCTTFTSHVSQGECCVEGGQPCPAAGAEFQCCYAFAHPDEPSACESPVLQGGVLGLPVCRPFSLSSGA